MKICEVCGKEHDGTYGSGKFCSKHCRYVYIGKQNKRPVCNFKKKHGNGNWKCCWCDFIAESKNKLIKHKQQKHKIVNGSSWNKGLTKDTSDKVLKAARKLKNRYITGEIHSSMKGKHLTEQTRQLISNKRKEFLNKHPEKVPYLLNHSSKISYPERYFKLVFF